MADFAVFAAGFAFRVVRIAVESSLYLLIGFLVAGGMRAWVGPAGLRRLFGAGRWSGPVRAWGVATVLLPVCSLGVLPILAELRRSGVRRDAVLTIALAAPMLNPVSLLAILSYLGPAVLVILVGGAFLVTVAAGVIGGMGPEAETVAEPEAEPTSLSGSGRVRAAAGFAALGASGPILADIAGVARSGLAAACLSPGWLAEGAFRGDPWAIPRIAAVALPAYLTPEKGMVALPEMLKFGQSAGAMFALLVLGVGMTAGHVSWVARAYGGRTLARWLLAAIGLSLAGAYAVDRLVPAVGTANADNDHFEELANPFDASMLAHAGTHFARYFDRVPPFHWATLAAVAALAGAGVALRRRGERAGVARVADRRSVLDVAVPRRAVAAVGVLAGLGVGVVGAYAFFPAPAEVFQDVSIIKADFYGEIDAPSRATPLHQLDLWDRQMARLPVGALIRRAPRTADAAPTTAEIRAGIGRLRAAVEAGRSDQARSIFQSLQPVHARCRAAHGLM